jgi:hypothetical protein
MTFKYIAISGMTLKPKEVGTTATLTPTTAAKTKVRAGALPGTPLAGVYAGDISVSITNATDGTYTQTGPPVIATLKPTAGVHVTAESDKVIREDDEAATVVVPGQDGSGNPGTIDVTVTVDAAGQNKVRAQ